MNAYDPLEQTSFTYDRELEVNGGSNTDRTLAPVRPDAGRRVRSVYLTEENKSGVIGRRKVMGPDAGGQRPVDSSKGPDLRKCDRTRPVSGDRTLCIQRPVVYSKHPRSTGRVRSVLTGPCQRPVITWKLLRGLN